MSAATTASLRTRGFSIQWVCLGLYLGFCDIGCLSPLLLASEAAPTWFSSCSLYSSSGLLPGFPFSSVLMSHRVCLRAPALFCLPCCFSPLHILSGWYEYSRGFSSCLLLTTLPSTCLAQICFLSARHIQRILKWTTPCGHRTGTSYSACLEMSLSSSSALSSPPSVNGPCYPPQRRPPKIMLAPFSLDPSLPVTPSRHEV